MNPILVGLKGAISRMAAFPDESSPTRSYVCGIEADGTDFRVHQPQLLTSECSASPERHNKEG